MASLPENDGAEMDSMILSNDLLTQFQRTLAETSPGQMQADLQTILAASMSMAASVGTPHDYCSLLDSLRIHQVKISRSGKAAIAGLVHQSAAWQGFMRHMPAISGLLNRLRPNGKRRIGLAAYGESFLPVRRLACRG